MRLGRGLALIGRGQEGRGPCDQALGVFRATGDRCALAGALLDAAWIASFPGEAASGRALCEEALTVCEEVEDARTEALALLRLGWMHFQRGAYREARTLVDRGLSRARAARDARTEAKALGILACLDHAAGENERSRRGYEAAIAIAREQGDSVLEATQQTNMAEDLRDRGELDASRVAFEAALAIRSRPGDAYNGPITLAEYAALVHLSGDRREALAVFARAEAGLRAIPHRYQLAMLLSNRATLEAAHDADRSRADIAETEAILRDLGASDDSAPARRLRGARAALEGRGPSSA